MTGRAVAGQRTAVNLQGVDLADVERGMVATIPNLSAPLKFWMYTSSFCQRQSRSRILSRSGSIRELWKCSPA